MNPDNRLRKSVGEYRVWIMSCFSIWRDPKSERDPAIGLTDVLIPFTLACSVTHYLTPWSQMHSTLSNQSNLLKVHII